MPRIIRSPFVYNRVRKRFLAITCNVVLTNPHFPISSTCLPDALLSPARHQASTAVRKKNGKQAKTKNPSRQRRVKTRLVGPSPTPHRGKDSPIPSEDELGPASEGRQICVSALLAWSVFQKGGERDITSVVYEHCAGASGDGGGFFFFVSA